jgi:DNA-binding MarR family transcriptional regulator
MQPGSTRGSPSACASNVVLARPNSSARARAVPFLTATALHDSTDMPYSSQVPDDADARFRTAYWRAFREVDSLRVRQWERSRVTVPQLRVLYLLRRHPGATTGELARHLSITVSTTSGLVIKLVDRGLVVRGRGTDDRRREPLELSEDGAALLGEVSEDGRVLLASVAEALGDDLGAVTQALERLGNIMALAQPALLSANNQDTAAKHSAQPVHVVASARGERGDR